MISLTQYILESFKDMDGRILLFDIDDTILKSESATFVMKDGEKIRELTPSEFNFYKLKPGEYFDFSEFQRIENMNKGTFTPYWNTLRREYSKGTHIGILTARSSKPMIIQFFKEHGFPIRKDLCMVVNDPHAPYTGNIEERKAQAIEGLIKQGYKLFVFFDDSETNLQFAKQLESQYPIKIKTVHVKS